MGFENCGCTELHDYMASDWLVSTRPQVRQQSAATQRRSKAGSLSGTPPVASTHGACRNVPARIFKLKYSGGGGRRPHEVSADHMLTSTVMQLRRNTGAVRCDMNHGDANCQPHDECHMLCWQTVSMFSSLQDMPQLVYCTAKHLLSLTVAT